MPCICCEFRPSSEQWKISARGTIVVGIWSDTILWHAPTSDRLRCHCQPTFTVQNTTYDENHTTMDNGHG